LGSEKPKYLKWLLLQSVAPKTEIENVITEDALALLSEKLSTPLQFEYYLTRALEEAVRSPQNDAWRMRRRDEQRIPASTKGARSGACLRTTDACAIRV